MQISQNRKCNHWKRQMIQRKYITIKNCREYILKKLSVLFTEKAAISDQTLKSGEINVEIVSIVILTLVALMTHSKIKMNCNFGRFNIYHQAENNVEFINLF